MLWRDIQTDQSKVSRAVFQHGVNAANMLFELRKILDSCHLAMNVTVPASVTAGSETCEALTLIMV